MHVSWWACSSLLMYFDPQSLWHIRLLAPIES